MKRFKLPQWYLYGGLIALVVETFFTGFADKLWLGGCYLVLGGVYLITKNIWER